MGDVCRVEIPYENHVEKSVGDQESREIKELLAHRGGRTRSLEMTQGTGLTPRSPKSLTLYPIELGGLNTNIITLAKIRRSIIASDLCVMNTILS